MSLFQAREWWSVPSESDEEYDNGCMVVANVDNSPDGDDKIVTGSLSGILRVYKPSSPTQRASTTSTSPSSSSFLPTDLLLELVLDGPILQLSTGIFLQGLPSTLALAVLHPHKLSVYTVVAESIEKVSAAELLTADGADATGSSSSDTTTAAFSSVVQQQTYRLARQYEHVFAASSSSTNTNNNSGPNVNFVGCNMCIGPFGASSSRSGSAMFQAPSTSTYVDCIAVQSMDGQLSVFEGSAATTRRQLEGILLPGPIVYVPRTDTFVTVASDLCVVGYRYSALLSSSGGVTISSVSGGGISGGKDSQAAATAARIAAATAAVVATDSKEDINNNVLGGGSGGSGGSGSGGIIPVARLSSVKPDWSINVGEVTSFLHVGRCEKATIEIATAAALGVSTASSSATSANNNISGGFFGSSSSSAGNNNGVGGGGVCINNTGGALLSPVDLMLIGDHTLFTLRDAGNSSSSSSSSSSSGGSNGQSNNNNNHSAIRIPPSSVASTAPIRSQKRIDFSPVATCCFPRHGTSSSLTHLGKLGVISSSSSSSSSSASSIESATASSPGHNLMIASSTGTLLVYREDVLAWSARIPFVPAALGVGKFAGQQGLTVLLSPRGDISVTYMGTEPPTGSLVGTNNSASSSLSSRTPDFAEMEAEYRRLTSVIRDANVTKEAVKPQDSLIISASISNVLDELPRRGCACLHGAGVVGGSRNTGDWWDPEDVEFETDRGGRGSSGDGNEDDEYHQTDESSSNSSSTVASDANPWIVTATVNIAWSGPSSLSGVNLTLHPPPWLRIPVNMRNFTLPPVPSSSSSSASSSSSSSNSNNTGAGASGAVEPLKLLIPFRASRRGIPADATIRVAATYIGAAGEARAHTFTFQAPLCVACCLCPPLKTTGFKVTVDTNRPAAALTALFPDLLKQPSFVLTPDAVSRIQPTATSVLTFYFPSGADMTILVSKAAGRYRLQGAVMEAAPLILQVLTERLARYFAPDGPGTLAIQQSSDGGGSSSSTASPPFAASFAEPLPEADLFDTINQHLQARHSLLAAYSGLNDRAHEYRLVTKRLLIRFKDRTPAPLNRLDVLLERAQMHVMEAGTQVAAAQHAVASSAAILSGRVLCFLLLLKLAYQIDTAAFASLRAHFSPVVSDALEYGWEESVDTSLTHLLRTGMTNNKTGGSSGSGSSSSSSQILPTELGGAPADSTKLRKHVAILVDRLSKGVAILP